MECDNYVYHIAPRTLPKGLIYRGGSDFFCLSRDFVKYILQKDDPFIHGLYSVFNYTQSAPEKFFQVALRNSKFCTTHINSNIRLSNFDRAMKKGWHCQRPADFCGGSPIILNLKDLKRLDIGRKHDNFFARKFDSTVDMAIINDLDLKVFGLDVPNMYWLNIWDKK